MGSTIICNHSLGAQWKSIVYIFTLALAVRIEWTCYVPLVPVSPAPNQSARSSDTVEVGIISVVRHQMMILQSIRHWISLLSALAKQALRLDPVFLFKTTRLVHA
jgi:hypothetical protein